MTPQELYDRLGMIVQGDRIHTDKMMPCPFCGCEMELQRMEMLDKKTIRYDPVPKGHKHKAGCQLEFCGGGFIAQPTTIKGAINKWNRRKGKSALVEYARQDLKNMNDPLEPIKVASALQSELMKLEIRKKNNPKDISILDYTIIAALLALTDKEESGNGRQKKHLGGKK